MADNNHLIGANSVHSTNNADSANSIPHGMNNSNGASNVSVNDVSAVAAVNAAAASIVTASASSSVGRLGGSNSDNDIIIPFSSSDLDALRVSLANGNLIPSSSNINVCLNNNGSIVVNTDGGGINSLSMDAAVLSNLNHHQSSVVSANGAHLIHSNEISSNGIVDERALASINAGEQSSVDLLGNSCGMSNSIVARITNAMRGNVGPSSNQPNNLATRGILANVSIDETGNFLTQGSALGQGVLSHNDLDFSRGHVILTSNSEHDDHGQNNPASLGLSANQQGMNSSVVAANRSALLGSAGTSLIAVTATANIHHRATASNSNANSNSVVSSMAPSEININIGAGTSSTNVINSSLSAATSESGNTQSNQSLWIQPDQSAFTSSARNSGLSLRVGGRQGSSSLLPGPSSSSSVSNQSLHGLQHAVQMRGDSFNAQIREHFPGTFQLPGHERSETFQAAAHSTFGHASPATATEYRDVPGDSEATPSYPSMHQDMAGDQVAESINAAPTVDSSTLPQGYNLVYHADSRKFSMQRVISPSDCTVSQSTLNLEGSEAQANQPLLPMAGPSNQAYAMVHISSMPSFSQGGAGEVSTSSMSAVLGVEERPSNGPVISSLDASQSIVVLHKLENASHDGATECDTTQGDIDFRHSRTPPYIATSNSIDEDAGLGSSSDLHTTMQGQGSGGIMDATLDSTDLTSAMEARQSVGRVENAMQLAQDVTPSTSGLQQEEENSAMAGSSQLFSNVTDLQDENLPQSSGLAMYVRKSRRLELQEQEPKASQRKRDFSYRSQPYRLDMLWCDECMRAYECECVVHRMTPVADRIVLTRAWASCPSQVQIFRLPEGQGQIGDTGFGVSAKRQLPKSTQFGPFVGNLVESLDEIASSCFPLMLEQEDGTKKYYETSDENASNWMKFVRRAKTFAEQNLVAYQYNNGIYFSVTKLIEAKQELKVWYAAHYAERLGLKPLELTEQDMQALDEEDAKFPCFECSRKFKSSSALQKHLEMVHESEDLLDMEGIDDDYGGVDAEGGERGRDKRKSMYLRGKLVQGKNRNRNGESSNFQWKKKSTSVYLSKTLKKYKKRQTSDKGANQVRSIYRRQGKESGENEWVCTHCGLTFDKQSLLNLHTLTHAAEDLVAGEARMQLLEAGGSDLVKQEGEESGVVAMIACPKCSIVFTDQRELMNHVASHAHRLFKRERPYECGECSKAFVTEEKLARHQMVHGKDEDKPLECEVCHKRLINNSALACHMKTHSERKYYDCPICQDDFEAASALREHGLKHADANGNFPCPSCSKVFEDFTMTRKHIKAFHSSRTFECEHCGKEFPRYDKLKLHKLKHTSHREFMCETCGRQFKRKDKLMEHMKRMHSKERVEQKIREKQTKDRKFIPKVMPTEYHRFIYKCHSCLLGFKRRGMLVNHLAKRHPDIKPEQVPELNLPILKTQRDFYCQYCDKIYKSSSKRKAHIIKNHPGSQVPPSARKRLVLHDPASAVTSNLGVNAFSHTVGSITTVPHGCKFCHKQYASKAKLLQHQRIKHNELVEPAQPKRHGKSVRSDFLQIAVGDPTSGLQERYETLPMTVVTQTDALPTGDLLTQAMTEIQNYEYITPRLATNSAPTMVHIQPNLTQTIDLSHLNQAIQNLTSQNGVATVLAPPQVLPHHSGSPASPSVSVVGPGVQQIALAGNQIITRAWPTTFTTQFS